MNQVSHQPLWYWAATVLLVGAGVGALWSPKQGAARAIRMPPGLVSNSGPSMEELTHDFRVFREEVAQLTPEEQDKVWQCLSERTQSQAERTLYTFFALPEGPRREVLDRTIDRIELRRQMFPANGWEPGRERTWVREVSGEGESLRPFSEMSLDERLSLRRDMWEDATPQAYAMRNEFLRLMNERRQQRGMPEPVFRRWG